MPHEGMVHALQMIWRVLVNDGILMDLRPLSARCPIEVVTPEVVVQIGAADGMGMAEDDAASDEAVREAVDNGWFVQILESQFYFDFYWDSVAEMSAFLQGSKRMKEILPAYDELEILHNKIIAREGPDARLRCRRPTMLAAYQKASRNGDAWKPAA